MTEKTDKESIADLLSNLKREVEITKEIQKQPILDLSVESVIKVTYRVGLGTSDDPVRDVNSYWDKNGNHLFDL
ncbi:hypothetical protein [Lactobacillus johnsonii]|uniref:hypothetical protein n=1 Tax=Lactobacillus johnsonii TaxID=33959 RepID=UPI001FB2CCB2|nr:hypothetical protein [Lactobacillus johnsonii]UOC07171.1 hypothetical protein LC811_04970 [Lactobacillus johnsonii]